MSRKGERPLRDDERDLWGAFSKAVKPLKKRPAAKADAAAVPIRIEKVVKKAAVVAAAPVLPAPKSPPPLATLGRREKAKVARGRVEIGGRLDLHGHTQAEAKARLHRFLENAQAREHALVLVITGKGKRGADSWSNEGGILKRQVPLWLALPEFRSLVIGFEEAGIRHGGAGALYIRVRRRR